MDPALWQHGIVELTAAPIPENVALQTFASGVLFGVVVLAGALLLRRLRRFGAPIRRRRPFVTGWGDLFRLLGSITRGVFFLVFGFLLLCRFLFWPAGRRW